MKLVDALLIRFEKFSDRLQVCNCNAPLDVHHNTYERRGQERPSDLIALCRPCHEKHHDILGHVNADVIYVPEDES